MGTHHPLPPAGRRRDGALRAATPEPARGLRRERRGLTTRRSHAAGAGAPFRQPGLLRSERLALLPLPLELLTALLADGPDAFAAYAGVPLPPGWVASHRRVLEWRRDQLLAGQDPRWLLRAVVELAGRTVVGRAGFHAPPDGTGMVEIGYAVEPPHRRRGYGAEAAARLIEWAETDPAVTTIRASVAPGNEPSLRIIRRLGFVRVGEQIDELDGLEWLFERRRPG